MIFSVIYFANVLRQMFSPFVVLQILSQKCEQRIVSYL